MVGRPLGLSLTVRTYAHMFPFANDVSISLSRACLSSSEQDSMTTRDFAPSFAGTRAAGFSVASRSRVKSFVQEVDGSDEDVPEDDDAGNYQAQHGMGNSV